jgi:hypothetical protein
MAAVADEGDGVPLVAHPPICDQARIEKVLVARDLSS